MIRENTKLLLKLFYSPLAAMSGIMDEGSWLYGAAAVILVSATLSFTVAARIYASYEGTAQPSMPAFGQQRYAQQQRLSYEELARAEKAQVDEEDYYDEDYYEPQLAALGQRQLPFAGKYAWWVVSFAPSSMLTTVLMLALLYVPGTILLIVWLEPLGSFGVVLRRDYAALLNCTLMAWAASHLPLALAGVALWSRPLDAEVWLGLWLASVMGFAVLMICALRTVFGAGFGRASAGIGASWITTSLGAHLFSYVSPFLASPFVLYFVYQYVRGDIGTIGEAHRHKQNFRRALEASTLNPRDAEAHYQLGLVYQNRRQYTEAIARFTRAVEIDRQETDAHFQLGRIARERGQLQEAIERFGTVVAQDDKHSHSEIWREVGATYTDAGMYAEAREALERYVERRPFDPEGLYYLGTSLHKSGQPAEAHLMFERCIEAVKTMPYYRRSQVRKWCKLAQEQLAVGSRQLAVSVRQ